MTRERAVVALLRNAVQVRHLSVARAFGHHAHRTCREANRYRDQALALRYGTVTPDGFRPVWMDLTTWAQTEVWRMALELATTSRTVHPDIKRRQNRERRRRSMTPAERERYDQRRPLKDRGRKK